MGHIVNPVSYRLYNIRYWNNNWFVANTNNYSYIINQDILINKFLKKFLLVSLDSTEAGVIFVNLKIIRSFNLLNLYIYIHDGFLDMMFFNLKKNRKFLALRRVLIRKFFFRFNSRYLNAKKNGRSLKLFRMIRKKVILKYARKLLFLFLKNKILKVYWDNFKNLFRFYMKKIAISVPLANIFIVGLSKNNVNANIISEFFFIRLSQYYTIWEVLKNINYLFRSLMHRRKKIVKGYRITCSGRFSRKQRATYSCKTFGSLALSTMRSKLDYSYRTIALKYSACTIKVWVRLNRKKTHLIDFVV